MTRSSLLKFLIPLLFTYQGCQKELSVSPEETFPKKNGLFIGSNPDSALIYINGKNTGQRTPDTIFWMHPGNVVLTLKKELFKDSTVTVNIPENDTVSIFLDYTTNRSMLGKLYIDSNPRGSKIFLNDSDVNKVTPATIEGLVPGYYRVKFRQSGYWDDVKIAAVKSVVTTYIDQQLTDTLVWINYDMSRTPIPSNYISSIAIDNNYIKWIGTLDEGLVRYDDTNWEVYNMYNSIIPDNNINSVAVDSYGNVWICTNYGVVRKSGDNWTLFTAENSGLPDNKVLSVTTNGPNICFGTMNKGLVIFDGSNWVQYTTENSLMPSNQVNMVLYNDINLWACTNNGLVKITDTTWKIINYSNSSNLSGGGGPGGTPRPTGFPTNNCKTIAIDKLGKPWVGFGNQAGAAGGSAVLRVVYWRAFHSKPSDEVFSIAVDNNNVKWFGSSENGLSKYQNVGYLETWTHYRMNNSPIKSDRIFSVVIDQNGYKWMASFGGGLIKYKGI